MSLKNERKSASIRKNLFFGLFLAVLLLSRSYGFASKNVSYNDLPANTNTSVARQSNSAIETSATADAIDKVCNFIYNGEFLEAEKIINSVTFDEKSKLSELKDIIKAYNDIQLKHEQARQKSFDKEFAKIEKLQTAFAADDFSPIAVSDINDINDLSDVNDLVASFAIVARVAEYANTQQKQQLLDNEFVKTIFSSARQKGAEYEAQGKWLDSYVFCYSWLAAINKENKQYVDYAEELLDRSTIVASFQNSPCETSSERYKGVSKQAFINSLQILEINYVSRVIDYKEMFNKGIIRCKLLSEVLVKSRDEIIDNISEESPDSSIVHSFEPPTEDQLANWSMGLDVIKNDMGNTVLGVGFNDFVNFFNKILELNKKTAKLPETILVAQFAEASFTALDPYTVIIWPQQTKEFEKLMTNEFSGIGVEISKPTGFLTVGSLLPDSPAYKAGLDVGDIIEKVDGTETKDMSLSCAVKHITGPKGSPVVLTVRRKGQDTARDVNIIRDRIVVRTIRGWQRSEGGDWHYMVDEKDKIAYVRMTSFTEKTEPDFERVLIELEKTGINGLIFDLRNNTGGLLSTATDVVDKFINGGLIVSTVPRYSYGTYNYAKKRGTHPDYPIVMLINSGSASASEIVSGALSDRKYKRAVLVGERTHGKGSVQTITSRPGDGAQLKYTMAHYHLPSGQKVESQDSAKKDGRDNWGIGPDIEVKMGNGVLGVNDEIEKMLEARRANDTLVQNNHKTDAEEKKYTLEETLESDPQLAVALLVMKTKLLEAQNKPFLAKVSKPSEQSALSN